MGLDVENGDPLRMRRHASATYPVFSSERPMKTNTLHLESNAAVSGASKGLRSGAAATTWIFAVLMAASGVAYLANGPPAVIAVHELGYPLYFVKLLGFAKILGALALVGPHVRVLREWAYAGFVFDLIAAAVSHAATGDAGHVPLPVAMLALLFASYSLRRRVAEESR
jgi:hypothetical protein